MRMKMKYGARKGTMNFWRRWFAKAASQELVVFPVPGADFLRQYQDEPMGKEVRLAVSPREANVLLVIGDLNTELAESAATVFAQMPRPRVLVIAGPEHLEPLPQPDVHTALEKGFLAPALEAARKCLADFAWNEEAEPYRPETLVKEIEKAAQQQGHMHDHHAHGDHGHGDHDHNNEDHDHSAHKHSDHGEHEGHDDTQHEEHGHCHHTENAGQHEGHDHDSHDHDHSHENHDQSSHQHGGHNHDHSGHNHSAHEHDHSQHGGHDHGSGFMSMIAMTKDLPRSPDGLPMEWSDVQFGPFHQGLPGGLRLSLRLDGDTVAEAEVDRELPNRNLQASVPDDPAVLPEYLKSVNPMAPVSYRLLAHKALANFSGDTTHTRLTLEEAVLLEKERVISHLNWLAVFSAALGSNWMQNQAIEHYHHFQNDNDNREQLSLFMKRIKKLPYLKIKLSALDPRHLDIEGYSQNHEHHGHDHNQGNNTHSDHGNHHHDHGDHSHDHGHHSGHKQEGHDHSAHQQGNADGGGQDHDHEDHEHHGSAGHKPEAQKSKHDSFTGLLKENITGPPARAAGLRKDVRLHEEVYLKTGWSPSTASGNDAWSRLLVRLDEISHSLQFIEEAKSKLESEPNVLPRQDVNSGYEGSGEGSARIESPRGEISLQIHIHEGKLAHLHLATPSSELAKMAKFVTQQQELSDALIAVTSLDISPWEINP